MAAVVHLPRVDFDAGARRANPAAPCVARPSNARRESRAAFRQHDRGAPDHYGVARRAGRSRADSGMGSARAPCRAGVARVRNCDRSARLRRVSAASPVSPGSVALAPSRRTPFRRRVRRNDRNPLSSRRDPGVAGDQIGRRDRAGRLAVGGARYSKRCSVPRRCSNTPMSISGLASIASCVASSSRRTCIAFTTPSSATSTTATSAFYCRAGTACSTRIEHVRAPTRVRCRSVCRTFRSAPDQHLGALLIQPFSHR